MKVNVLYGGISVAVSALIAYGIYSFCRSDDALFLAIGCLVFTGFPLFLAMGVSGTSGRATVNMKVLAVVFFVILLVANIVFTILPTILKPLYIISNGIADLVCFSIYHKISKTEQTEFNK